MRPRRVALLAALLLAGAVCGFSPALASPPASGSSRPLPLDAVKPLVDSRRFADAEKLARDLLAASEASHGSESLETGQALDALVHVLLAVTDPPLDELRRTARRAVAVKEARVGREHLEFGTSLNHLGRMHMNLGEYEEARSCFEEAARVKEKLRGPRHLEVGKAWNNVAIVLVRMGEYAAARPLYDRVIGIFREAGAPEHPEISSVMNNLGILQNRTGDYAEARKTFEEVLRIQEAALGGDAPQLGGTLGNLGSVTHGLNDLAACRRYWERVRVIWGKDPGPESSSYAAALAHLGDVLLYTGEADEGARLIDQALATHEKLGLMGAKEVPTYQNYKAYALALQGDMNGSRDYYRRSLDRQRELLGPDHPTVAGHAFNLAQHLYRMGDSRGAFDLALESDRILREHLRQTFPVLSEREALHYEMSRRPAIDLAITVLLARGAGAVSPDDVSRVWDSIARSRAIVLDEVAARQREGRQGLPGSGPGPADRLAQARRKVSRLLVRGPAAGGLEKHRRELKLAVEDRESAERDLARASAVFGRGLARREAGLKQAIASLPAGTALVAYVKFLRYPTLAGKEPTPSYAALSLGSAGSVARLVSLGAANEIESAIDDWRREVSSDPRSSDPRTAARRYGRAASRLREVIWDPAWSTLQRPERVILVPDGAVSLVSFATLTDRDGNYLVETGPTLHYVSAERDLVRGDLPEPRGGEAVIVGGPDFDTAPAGPGPAAGAARPGPAGTTTLASHRSPRAICGAFGGLRFDPLPQARAEADEIASLWAGSGAVRKLTGAQADEATVKALAPAARLLHLSTHAFFMAEQCGTAVKASGDLRASGLEYSGAVLPEDSLIFSGLALAGANRREEPGSSGLDEDGVLTAEEISSLDLSKVEWAVLSACETGLGRLISGEGVLGLRRAFESASARTLIMSLWSVEDAATRTWMAGLYRKRLEGLDTAESVKEASLERIEDRGRVGASRHPFFWGAFVASGDWR